MWGLGLKLSNSLHRETWPKGQRSLLGVELRQVESMGVVFKVHNDYWEISPFILREMLGEIS